MRSNFLMIMLDDLNSWTGALGGHPDARTPNIDALAESGVLFSRAYCAAPYCNASRMSVMLGLLPSRSGIYENEQIEDAAPGRAVIPELLRQGGYTTASFGKVFHGMYDYAAASRHARPFATWKPFSDRAHYWDLVRPPEPEPMPLGRPLNRLFDFARFDDVPPMYHHFDWGYLPDAMQEEMPDTRAVRAAQRFLAEPGARPFFCAVGIYKPHLPWYVPQRFFTPLEKEYLWLPPVKADDLDDVPATAREWALSPRDHELVTSRKVWHDAVRGYLASISFADALVGELLSALASSPARDDTTVVLCSDNGFHLGEKLHWRKFALWEEATRVPLIVVPPRGMCRERHVVQPVSLVDLYPTILELAGIAPGTTDGAPLTRILAGAGVPDRPAISVWGRGNFSMRYGPWRYTRYRDGGTELYDRSLDPLEWTNRAGRLGLAETRARLDALLESHVGWTAEIEGA